MLHCWNVIISRWVPTSFWSQIHTPAFCQNQTNSTEKRAAKLLILKILFYRQMRFAQILFSNNCVSLERYNATGFAAIRKHLLMFCFIFIQQLTENYRQNVISPISKILMWCITIYSQMDQNVRLGSGSVAKKAIGPTRTHCVVHTSIINRWKQKRN